MGAGLCQRRSERSSERERSGGCAHQGGRSAKRSDRENRRPRNILTRRCGSSGSRASRAANGRRLGTRKTRDRAPRSHVESQTDRPSETVRFADGRWPTTDYFLLFTAIFSCFPARKAGAIDALI